MLTLVKDVSLPKEDTIRKDDDFQFILRKMKASQLSIGEIQELILDVSNNTVHISYKTLARWLDGSVKHPHNYTLTWVGKAFGYERSWHPIRNNY